MADGLFLRVWDLSAPFYKALCYFSESIFRPFHEPVDSGVVDECGVHAAVVSELFANGRHADRDVQVSAHSVKEEFINCIWSFDRPRHLQLEVFSDGLTNSLELVGVKEIRDLARAQNIAHIFQKGFLDDIVIREEEDACFVVSACGGVERLQELAEVLDIEGARHFYLQCLHFSHVGCQFGQ